MITIKRFKKTERPDLAEMAYKIRNTVFVTEQKVDPDIEYDEFEDTSNHYLLFFDDIPVTTARWRETGDGIKLERFATLKEYRGRKFGDAILERVLDDIKEFDLAVYLHSQLKAVPFYERRGFVKKGNIFIEADIKHYNMWLT